MKPIVHLKRDGAFTTPGKELEELASDVVKAMNHEIDLLVRYGDGHLPLVGGASGASLHGTPVFVGLIGFVVEATNVDEFGKEMLAKCFDELIQFTAGYEDEIAEGLTCNRCHKSITDGRDVATPAGSMHPRCAEDYEREKPEDW